MPRLTTSRPRSGSWICASAWSTCSFVGAVIAWHVTGNLTSAPRAAFAAHQAACRRCTVCADEKLIAEASPTFSGEWDAKFLLVGQAPGRVERESRRPFSGRAGKELDRWMLRAGFESDEEFRRVAYIAALMRCFPGRNPRGTGDLRPPPAGIANCAHWLDGGLRRPRPGGGSLGGELAIGG